jgi:signal transduction histidine kinase
MMDPTAFVAAVVVVCVGLMIFWANPNRMVNRTVCTCSMHAALWLTCWQLVEISADRLFWFRWTCVVGALIPLHLWIVKEAIASELARFDLSLVRQGLIWLGISGPLAIIPLTQFFIPANSTAEHRVYGLGYYGYIAGTLGLYCFLLRDALRSIKRVSGVQRLELQVWLGGGCAVAATILARMALSALTKDQSFGRLQPLVILVFYVVTAYAITTHRIFDARQLMRIGLRRIVLVVVVGGVAYVAKLGFELFLPASFAWLATTAVALWLAALLSGWLDLLLHYYPQAMAVRQAAFDVARRETGVENLETAFRSVLKGWGQTDHAVVLSGGRDFLRGGGLELAGDGTVVQTMRQLRWVTPERLARERPTPGREEVARFLKQNGLGVLVVGEGPTLSVLLGVGIAASRQPFTYPQVTQLTELASIMESALERAHFSAKVQHTEQLATVGLLGASLAHEIRNPLVTIKTFVQLLPKHYQDAAFREKFFRLIGDEVGRIDRLTEQLLDLASPRAYASELIELHPVLRASVDLVAAKAADRQIRFLTDFQAAPNLVFTDASAAKQVMLNLCFNAIQAAEGGEGERWVKVSTRNVANGVEMAVADSGPGIAPEIRPRLFQPFQTTKSSGFGLGLAICSDILANLHATISVDPAAAGTGATFRVTFPCQPS